MLQPWLFCLRKIRPCAGFGVTLFSTALVPYNIFQLPDATE